MLNMILFSILIMYIVIEEISVIINAEYDPSCNSNLSFYVKTDILNSLLSYNFFIFFHTQ